jgi:UDP-glucose 4-epimerase
MNRCCIIGGSGFIGQHLLRQLVPTGRDVIVLDRCPKPLVSPFEKVTYLQADYAAGFDIDRILPDLDEIILLAHTTTPKASFDDPLTDLSSNVPAAVRLFGIAADAGIKKIIFVSSGGTVYGKATDLPISESHSTNPISPYGITKLTIEKYALMYHALKSLPVVCVRPGNAYGEGQRPFSGQGFIATAMGSILQRKELSVYGETGTVRDYIHVSDLVAGIIAALEDGIPGECYNIGTGIGHNNKQILDRLGPLAASSTLDILYQTLPDRSFDVPVNILDSSKLRKHTGWYPTIGFEAGLQRMWDWFLETL